MMWHIKKFEDVELIELYHILKSRVEVFVVEQNCAYLEVDGMDIKAYHIFKYDDEGIIAYMRVFPKATIFNEASFGRVLVAERCRGNGLFKELVEVAMDFILNELEETTIKISAQAYLKKAYGKFGFKEASAVYLEDGIPHVDMIYENKERLK